MLYAALTAQRKDGAILKRVYWVQYKALVFALCGFLTRNRGKLPTDLKPAAATLYATLEALCLVLEAYDASHARGKGAAS